MAKLALLGKLWRHILRNAYLKGECYIMIVDKLSTCHVSMETHSPHKLAAAEQDYRSIHELAVVQLK